MPDPGNQSASASFKPYLWAKVVNEQRPSSIVMVALAGAKFFRQVDLPVSTDKDELALISEAVHAHFRHWRGCAGPWGRILGYEYRRSATERWQVSTEGQVESNHPSRIQ